MLPLKKNPLTDDHHEMLKTMDEELSNNLAILERLQACNVDCGVRPQNNQIVHDVVKNLKRHFFPDRA